MRYATPGYVEQPIAEVGSLTNAKLVLLGSSCVTEVERMPCDQEDMCSNPTKC